LVGPEGRRPQADAVPPVDPLAVPAVGPGTSPQLVAVAGIDEEDLKPLGLEQFVQGDPIDAGRFQGGRVDLMLPQEAHNGFQASRMSRERQGVKLPAALPKRRTPLALVRGRSAPTTGYS